MQRCISLNEVVGLFTSSDMNRILSYDCPLACVILTAANTVQLCMLTQASKNGMLDTRMLEIDKLGKVWVSPLLLSPPQI